jgi:type I restriction enzyme R subunit
MTSRNFEFLRAKRPELADLGGFAEHYTFTDPTSCLVKLRTYAESLVKAVFGHYQLQISYQSSLNDLMHDASFKRITPTVVQDKLHRLRIKGNHAAHGTLHPMTTSQIAEFVKEAHELGRWLHISLDQGQLAEIAAWHLSAPSDPSAKLQKEHRATRELLQQQEAKMAQLLEALDEARSKAEAAAKSEEEMRQILKDAQHAVNILDFSEEVTRKHLIDDMLAEAGWDIGTGGSSTAQVGQEIPVLHQPTNSGKGYADYVLWDAHGKPLAVLEIKKTAADAERGKMQAKYYADGLEKMHGQRPLIFYSNGPDTYLWDDAKTEPPRRVEGFYSQDSLEYALFRTGHRAPKLSAIIPKEAIIDRLYQIEANKRVTEAFDNRRRHGLLIQATGTGKTRVAIGLCDLMIRARWARRILFLCDRRELRKQAMNAFTEHLPSEPSVIVSSRTGEDKNKRIYLATYPAMMKCFRNFDVGFFDLIIADESHRSIYNRYRDLFRWFDAYQVGLTATPLKFVFRNTYRLFECENGDPTFNYGYEEAISHDPPYLCPFKVIKHTTKFLRDGIKYKDLTPEQREQLEDQVADSEAVDYSREQVSQAVFNEDTDKAILRNLMDNGIRNADGTQIGKTIIFARNHLHAKQLVGLFEKMYPQLGGDFCVRIDNQEPRAEQLIDDFKSTDDSKNLSIAVSVDMLDTGIDVPQIVNLVFAKPVRSYAKFWQMIGRGTRLCYDLFGPGKDKQCFQIFDHWGNFEFFDQQVKEEEPSRSKSLAEVLFETRIRLAQAALKVQDLPSFQLATTQLTDDVADLPETCLSVKEKWREIHQMKREGVIAAFQAATVATLRQDISPLMMWRPLHGAEAAYRFDLLISRLQGATVLKSATRLDLQDEVIEQVSALPINLTQVAEKLSVIAQAKARSWLEAATPLDLEYLRLNLRGIMKLRKKDAPPRFKPVYLNLKEDTAQTRITPHKPKLEGLDLAHYRNRVESVLQNLMEQSAALQKIRAGQPVASDDIEELVSEVLIYDPDLHLEELLLHYPNKHHRLDLAIRQIIGLDAEKVDESFRSFVQKYPALNANQIRFLELLKAQISRYGALELERLWEAPFTTIHGDGVDGVFTQPQQVDDLLALIDTINQQAA